MKKKIITTLIACVMTISLGVTSFATEREATSLSFNKVYKTKNDNTSNPDETFQFKFSNGTIAKGEQTDVTVPALPQVSTQFSVGTATKDGLQKPIVLGLENVTWPSVGIYTYDISEVQGTTAGVTYDSNSYKMDVQVEFVNGMRKPVQVTFYDEATPSDKKTEFTNVYSAGSLEIRKEVTGNMGDKEKDFTVKVTFTAPNKKDVNSIISYIEDGVNESINSTDWSNGSCTVTIDLKHDEAVTFNNIPYGVTYSVEENDYTSSGYDAAKYAENNGTANDGKGTINAASDNVKITNNKSVGIETGITMDSIPYILVLCAVAAGMIVFLRRKHMSGSLQ